MFTSICEFNIQSFRCLGGFLVSYQLVSIERFFITLLRVEAVFKVALQLYVIHIFPPHTLNNQQSTFSNAFIAFDGVCISFMLAKTNHNVFTMDCNLIPPVYAV